MPAKATDADIEKAYRRYQADLYQECYNDARRTLRRTGGEFPVERALDVATAFFQARCMPWPTFRNEHRAEAARDVRAPRATR